MTSVIAALSFGGEWHIHDKDAINTSFPSFLKILKKLGNELHFLFISSEASVEKSNSFKIKINSSKNPKCTRCWHRHASVGTSKEHPELCYRCIENIDDNGEQRSFV